MSLFDWPITKKVKTFGKHKIESVHFALSKQEYKNLFVRLFL
jgi:hypothetical protein